MFKKLILIIILILLVFLNLFYWSAFQGSSSLVKFECICVFFSLLFFIFQYLKAINKWQWTRECIVKVYQKLLGPQNFSEFISRSKHAFVILMLTILIIFHIVWGIFVFNPIEKDFILWLLSTTTVIGYIFQYFNEYSKNDTDLD